MTQPAPLLSISNLRFRWPTGQRDILDLPEFSVHQGERVFLKGESGSGKTTLLSLIGGINQPLSGDITILDTNLRSLKSSQRDQFRADHIGFIFQLFNLIPYLSVIENITLACKFSPSRTERALSRSSSLEEEAERLLHHLQLNDKQLIAKPVVELSVGQQQRVAAARALIGSPELIIADEPTSALDPATQRHFLELLKQECDESGSTLLFVSHDNALETLFDRTIQLTDINQAKQMTEATS